jgi:ClpP class serine protease
MVGLAYHRVVLGRRGGVRRDSDYNDASGQAGAGYVALVQLSGTISYSESPLALLSGETLTPSEVEELVGRIESDPFAERLF